MAYPLEIAVFLFVFFFCFFFFFLFVLFCFFVQSTVYNKQNVTVIIQLLTIEVLDTT